MRVGITMLTLVPGRVGGSEWYARSLCSSLAAVGGASYEVLVSRLAPDAGGALPSRVVTRYPAATQGPARAAAMAAGVLDPRVRRELDPGRFDVVHFPLSVMIPRLAGIPVVTTIHDVQHLLHPEFFSAATRAYRHVAYGWTARGSERVIAISGHVAETLVERLGVPAERVAVVHSGVDHARFTPPTGGAEREPFLFYPANAWPHKNHERLVEALGLLRRDRPGLRLVLTGADLDRVPRAEGVDVRGYVDRDEIVRLYRTASALVFPSLYEGFGQPLLEAMATGCPVAAADAASIPEVCGGAARLFDPRSPKAIAEAIADVLDDPSPWVAAGLARAAEFSWDETARQTEAVYRSALGSTAPGARR